MSQILARMGTEVSHVPIQDSKCPKRPAGLKERKIKVQTEGEGGVSRQLLRNPNKETNAHRWVTRKSQPVQGGETSPKNPLCISVGEDRDVQPKVGLSPPKRVNRKKVIR